MMEYKIFYSWQSDLPSQTNEQFIDDALKNVVQKLNNDVSLEVDLILDRDIANVPGSPDVAATILNKIDQSDIFVCDVSVINKRQLRNSSESKHTRLTSNPNVLVEFGYALKALGSDKIILVSNLAFGRHEDLPFDFRHKHVVGYNLSQDNGIGDYGKELKILEAQFEQKLRQILLTLNKKPSIKPSPFAEALTAIRNSQSNQEILISDLIDWIMTELDSCSPLFPKTEGKELDSLLTSIDKAEGLVADFTRLFLALVNSNSADILQFYRNFFERMIAKYNFPIGFQGGFSNARMRFYHFIGHELFVSLIALLFDADKLEIIADILDQTLYLENDPYLGARNVSFAYISMLGEASRQTSELTIEFLAEKLNKRHTENELAKSMPILRLVETDCFLSFRKNTPRWEIVIGDSLMQPPKFLIKATSQKYVQRLIKSLALDNLEEFKQVLNYQRSLRNRWLIDFDFSRIASTH